jgi:hypothetical protein
MDKTGKAHRLYISNNEIRVSCNIHIGNGGRRMKCKGISRKSRSHLLKLLNSIVFETAIFVTLTYRYNMQNDKAAYAHLRKWYKHMCAKNGNAGVIWKKELQSRGAIHYHMFILDAPKTWDKSTILNEWLDVTEQEGDYAARKYGVHVKDFDLLQRADAPVILAYMAKYASKESGETQGRPWGCLGRSYIRETGNSYVITEFQAEALVRYLRTQGCPTYSIDGGGVGSAYTGCAMGDASRPVSASLVGQGAVHIAEIDLQYLLPFSAKH